MQSSKRDFILLIIAVLAVFGMLVTDVLLGSVSIPIIQVLKAFLGLELDKVSWQPIILNSRLPQALTALSAGGGLALSGLLMQTLFNNYLAGPSVLGISSGASLLVSITVLFLGVSSGLVMAVSAVIGAILVLLIIVAFARKIKSNVTLLIVGLMLSFITSALISVLEFYANQDSLQLFVMWGLGSFANTTWQNLPIIIFSISLCLCASFMLVKPLNAMLLGEQYAKSLGIEVSKYRLLLLIITGIITGVITAFCGPIGFLGLAIPHVSRRITKSSNHLFLMPSTFLVGAIFGLLCDCIAKLPGSSNILPINGVTALIGSPIVIWVILKNQKLN